MKKHYINGKSVYVFEDHNWALLPWAEISNSLSSIPYLITLDHHTDTHPAFLNYAYWESKQKSEIAAILRAEKCAKINKNDTDSLAAAINQLRHDEHIDAAIKSNIITHSFSIQYSNSAGTLSREEEHYIERNHSDIMARIRGEIHRPIPPFNYSIPEGRMFLIPNICAVNCPRGPHTDECTLDHVNQALEDIFLEDKLSHITQMSITSGLGNPNSRPYILDIDLDYFKTLRSAIPLTNSVFYSLIKKAAGITIARETDCVEMLRLEGETITSDQLEGIILNHICAATSTADA